MSRLGAALDRLVPPFADDSGDWDEVLARAAVVRPRRRLVLAFAAFAVGAALLATPAFGLRGLVANLLGRIDVPFTGEAAPTKVKASFSDLQIYAPPSFAPGVIASQTRKVATFHVKGKNRVLWVAPTRGGGFCWDLSGAFGGCRAKRTLPTTPVRGRVDALLGPTWHLRFVRGVESVASIGGDVLARAGAKLVVRYADGSTSRVPYYFVSAPINAGFFLAFVPAGHTGVQTRATAVELFDGSDQLLARQTVRYELPAQVARDRALRIRAIRGAQRRPPAPPPTAGVATLPVQRATADGVTVVAGANGVIVFDLAHASHDARALLGQGPVNYECVRRLPYHPTPAGFGQWAGIRYGRAVIRMNGFRPPYEACDIQGSYGHTWPDQNGSHSAVELAFTPAGRRFFEDRATARDLAAFIRSQPFRMFRKLGGSELERALRTSRYKDKATRLDAVTAPLAAHRIGYVLGPGGATFVERSATGRRFNVVVAGGRVRGQNLDGFARAFF